MLLTDVESPHILQRAGAVLPTEDVYVLSHTAAAVLVARSGQHQSTAAVMLRTILASAAVMLRTILVSGTMSSEGLPLTPGDSRHSGERSSASGSTHVVVFINVTFMFRCR